MIPVENFRGYVAAIVAGIVSIGGPVLLLYAWLQPASDGRDLAIVFGAIGGVVGSATTFLFLQDSAARSSRASERAAEASSVQSRAAVNGHALAPLMGVSNYEPVREYAPPPPVAWAPEPVEPHGDRFEGDVEPDTGEKHPDEPQEPLPAGHDELADEPTPKRDS